MIFNSSAFRSIFFAALAAFAFAPSGQATATQTALEPSSSISTVQDELLKMAGRAGIIFAGEVLSVTPHPSFTPGSGTVEIVFRVDQPIRGCDRQATYTLHEWAGLWTAGRQRYIPGQRVLMLLHAPSASGLSSPVGGQDGVLPITGAGLAPKATDATIAQAEPTVDLRWLQSRLPRAAVAMQSSHLHSFSDASSPTGRATPSSIARRLAPPGILHSANLTPSLIQNQHTLSLSTGSRGISLQSILSMLAAWQAQQGNASH